MTRRYHRTGQDNWTPRPQSGFTREWVHGPLQPMQDDAPPREGRWVLLALLVFIFIVGTLGAAALP